MTALWENRDGRWRLVAPSSFPDEAALHDRIFEAPRLLPLSGSPQLTVLGREVRLGNGYADVIAVEHGGRPAVIEVKLARNSEARRAVVAQVLAYAAYLHGLGVDEFEQGVVGSHLRGRGHETVFDAVAADDQLGAVDRESFEHALALNLAQGRFRLVFVLDDAPEELVRLVGYLEAVTPELVIDLVAIGQYEIGGSQVLVPQRVDPERREQLAPLSTEVRPAEQSRMVPGADGFAARIADAPDAARDQLSRLLGWARGLEANGYVKLSTFHGKNNLLTLLPRLPVEDVGLVTVWFDERGGYLQFWRTVFERRAPIALAAVEQHAAPSAVRQGTTCRDVTPGLLDALTEAYREARQSLES